MFFSVYLIYFRMFSLYVRVYLHHLHNMKQYNEYIIILTCILIMCANHLWLKQLRIGERSF